MSKAESNRANGQHSTGPKTAEGKAKVSANALKLGFFANVERLNPQDSPAYQNAVEDLRMGLHPDGPVGSRRLSPTIDDQSRPPLGSGRLTACLAGSALMFPASARSTTS